MQSRMHRYNLGPEIEELANRVIGAALEVHRALGPGYLEVVYEAALCLELAEHNIPFKRQYAVSVKYRDTIVGSGVCDLCIADLIIVELKAINALAEVHEAQLISYLKMTGCKLGLLINFSEPTLKAGLRRLVHPSLLHP